MCDGNTCTGQDPSGNFQDLTRFLAGNPSSAWTTILHASPTSPVPEIFNFSGNTRLPYVSTSGPVLSAKHSASSSQPMKRRCRRSSKHTCAVANILENRSTRSQPGLENLPKKSRVQTALFCSARTNRLFFFPFSQSQRRLPSAALRAEESQPSHLSTINALFGTYRASRSSYEIARHYETTLSIKSAQLVHKR